MRTNHFKDLDIDKRIILKGIIKKKAGCKLDSSGSELGPVTCFCENNNDLSGLI
jgi:hypothetical protein